ncbi:MAG: response regulator [Eggerthellaceae bacterium]|nr:response regulator [Eggerthellaceae bacterium]
MTSKHISYARNRVIAAIVALLLILVAFGTFFNENHNRIVEQNADYIEGSTYQTARRIKDILDEATSHVQSVALVYGDNMRSADDLPTNLSQYAEGTNFDGFAFVSADGTLVAGTIPTRNDLTLSADFIRKGMAGETGAVVISPDTIDDVESDNSLIAFYSPLIYEGKILGVFVGVLDNAVMSDLLYTSFFGTQTNTFLCETDGNIIARASDFTRRVEDIFSLYADNANDVSYDQLVNAFATEQPITFSYQSSNGTGSATAQPVEGYDLILLRTFPEAVTTEMIQSANSAGVVLIAVISVAFVGIILLQIFQYRSQKRTLLLENQQATRIIDASTRLFRRFALLDLNNGSYEYLKNERIQGVLPPKGSMASFRAYWAERGFDAEDRAILTEILNEENLAKTLGPGVEFVHYEYRIRNHENPQIALWVQASVIPLERNSDGTPSSLLYTEQDVSDVKEYEQQIREQLKSAYQTAEASSKAKTNFLNSMSHDIRTPMNSIMGLTAIGAMHVDDPARVSEVFDKISVASRHLLGLINEVLDMARIESGTILLSEESFSLAESVESLRTIVEPQAAAKQLQLRISDKAVQHESVVGDAMRLQQVMVNIMGNAVKFTDPGGTVTLDITEKHSARPGYGCYEFVFADTGCGMAPEFLERIFEPFSRARDNRVTNTEGTGLGMTIVKSVVELMDGNIDVQSTLGEGTTFTVTVYLKLQDGEAGTKASESALDALQHTDYSGRRVLLVEDNPIAAAIGREILETARLTVEHAANGQLAVDTLAAHDAGYFDIVFMDIQMPVMNGYEATRAIRALAAEGRADLEKLPIIALSADAFADDVARSHAAGMDDHMAKPMELGELLKTLGEWLQ